MANWQKNAIDDLRKLEAQRNFLQDQEERLTVLDLEITSVKSALRDSTPVQGGTSTAEDRLINAIDEKARLGTNINIVSSKVAAIERALATLPDDERLILERFFIRRPPDYLDRLVNELGYEKSWVYEKKDIALRSFTIALYGIVDL